jgi:hypothetical protein
LYDPDGKLVGFSYRIGTGETLSVIAPKAGTWLAEVQGYRNFWEVELEASHPIPEKLTLPIVLKNVSGTYTSESFYKVTVPAGESMLQISTSGGDGDVDIYVRRNTPALTSSGYYDQRSSSTGNSETVTINNPPAGDYYITLYGRRDYSKVMMTVRGTQPPETIRATPPSCTLSAGSACCSVTIHVTNAGTKSLQVWVKGPQDSAEKAVTGIFTDATFSFPFPWIVEGTTTITLYEIVGTAKVRLATTTVTGQALKMMVSPSSCTILPATGRCSVTVQVTNPDKRPLQIWVKGSGDSTEKAATGIFSDESFSLRFDWIAEGATTFNLYEVQGSSKELLATATARGTPP